MGLDMYLYRAATPKDSGGEKVREQEVVGHWRKANQIHGWFVNNLQAGNDDCRLYLVSKEKLRELLNLCKQVLDDRSLAAELLPPTRGFFFGSTDFDEWYFRDLEDTIRILETVFATTNFNKQAVFYKSEW